MGFLAPLAFLGLALALPIILMYMLRLRRREQMVSSTFLWQRLIQDREANTPWQRLRRNLLLLLQLLILALLVLALMRPFVTVPAVSAERVALLLDASASMSAADGPQGQTRFAQAQQAAVDLVAGLSATSEISVIRVAGAPDVLTPYTTDRTQALQAIQNAQPSQGEPDWLAALTLASAGGASVEDFTMVLFSDGGAESLDTLPASSLPGQIRFVPFGQSADNVALSALATRALPGQPAQLFAQITNSGTQSVEVIFSLRVDDDPVPLVSERYTIPANASLPIVSSRALPEGFRSLNATLTPTVNSVGGDFLSLDNTAWAVPPAEAARRVLLVTNDNLFLEQALRSLPGVQVFRAGSGPLPTQGFDLTVYDRITPQTLPAGDVLLVGMQASVPNLFLVGEERSNPGQLQAESDVRMTFVDVDAVSVLRYRPLLDAGWMQPLVRAENGDTLISAGERDGRRVASIQFTLSDSDFPLQIGFPVLISNLLDWASPAGSIENPLPRVGEPVTLRPPLDSDAVRVTYPDGATTEFPVNASTLLLTDTQQRGVYQVDILSAGEVTQSQRFAVNLFSAQESDITPRALTLGGLAVARVGEQEQGQFELWGALALLALIVLMIEWVMHQRRTRPLRSAQRTRGASVRPLPRNL